MWKLEGYCNDTQIRELLSWLPANYRVSLLTVYKLEGYSDDNSYNTSHSDDNKLLR